MMKWKTCGAGLVLLAGFTPRLSAQIPAAPAAPVAPLAAPAAAPAAAPRNLFSFLFPTQEQKLACKEHICSTQIGQLLNNSLLPVGAFSGGLVGPCCPGFTQAELKMPADSAQGAAARIKADEAAAKARVAAVKYLARVDCHYWPEAADALVNALRGDRNECVRAAAAEALGTGCCCGKKTIVALSIAAAGSDRDGHPSEKSDRVKMLAQSSLENCLARCGCAIPLPAGEGPIEKPVETPKTSASAKDAEASGPIEPVAYYKKIEALPPAQVLNTIRQTVVAWSPTASAAAGTPVSNIPTGPASAAFVAPGGDHSLMGIVGDAFAPLRGAFSPRSAAVIPGSTTADVANASQQMNQNPTQPGEIQQVGYQPAKASQYAASIPASEVKTIPAAAPPAYAPSPYAMNGNRAASTQASRVPVAPAGYAPATMARLPQLTGSATPFPPANGVDVAHLLATLRDSSYAEQRGWAAAELAQVDWKANAQVVDAMIAAGEHDNAPAVRAQCAHSLGKMHVNTSAALVLLESLLKDRDQRVQQEARQALDKLDGEPTTHAIPATGTSEQN